MIKREEISDPNSCLNRADEEEPIFVLLGRDIATIPTIRYWISQRVMQGKNKYGDEQLMEALNLIERMEKWKNDKK